MNRKEIEKKLDELQALLQKWIDENGASCVVAVVRHPLEVDGRTTASLGMITGGEAIWEDAMLAWGFGVANERRRHILDQYKVIGPSK